ncbi:hypothetical protein PsAD2_00196 [Pseudovibrio axinellae]|uniref:Uncharacterized protein n=1 Tax=Pseudovibrio axinellae TaxID=989403 RepID=A0A166BE23_9HYPH|nr:hypothetical protein [Pseudovibrio axinellae]KZL22170.1 hypothetical protein PsAD2_00196 [Pseudovibrio axinellae]SEQ52573.1 hypothetical protein SAMN05421798_1033 [Pseudovibrio axinellae]
MYRKIAFAYALILFAVTSLNYIPGIPDENGYVFSIFALDLFDDSLHGASATWALVAALISQNASRIFLRYFGALYLADAVFGLLTGSGYLDFAIFTIGFQSFPLGLKILANLPHFALGGFALTASFWGREKFVRESQREAS